MSHLIFNSFPRSGNVFISNIAGHAFSMEMSAVHMPEIFHVNGLYNVSVFRKPEDAIASLINKTRENSDITDKLGNLDSDKIFYISSQALDKYERYVNSAKESLDNIHLVRFDDLVSDYNSVIEGIAKRFFLKINDGYQSKISLAKSSPIWASKYDGHTPREKDETRKRIEEFVASLSRIQKANVDYENLLSIV